MSQNGNSSDQIGAELLAALKEVSKEKGIREEALFEAIETGLVSAYKKGNNKSAYVRASIDRITGNIEVYAHKRVVEEVHDPLNEISLEAAREIELRYELGDLVEIVATPRNFGRIAAMTAKQVVVQKIREAERGMVYDEYSDKEHEILTAIVDTVENHKVHVIIGRTHGILEPAQQIPGEEYHPGDRIKVYVLEVSNRETTVGSQVIVSRTHPGLVKRLFEMEVPEIKSGTVQIMSIAREPGQRTKMAVRSTNPDVEPVGSCVGARGMRVENVVNELKTEKIDIIKWSNNPAEYIGNALNPARVTSVTVAEKEKTARVVVPDNQLSLAIGKEGQNARLAAKLTGWRIDIKSESQVLNEAEAKQAQDIPEQEQEEPAMPESGAEGVE